MKKSLTKVRFFYRINSSIVLKSILDKNNIIVAIAKYGPNARTCSLFLYIFIIDIGRAKNDAKNTS